MKKIVAILLLVCLLIVPMSQSVVALNIAYIGTYEIMEDIYDNKDSWYYDAALFVRNSGLHLAYEYHIAYFGPNESATRLELINMIAYYDWIHVRSSDVTEKQKICTAFSDVEDGTYAAFAAQWGYDNGITNGVGGGRFKPHSNVTREEFVTMVYRFAQKKGVDTKFVNDTASAYEDYGKVSKWARDAIDWACDIGLINGKTKTMIKPRDNVTRAEMAMIIYRFNNLVIAHDDLNPKPQ